MTGSFSFEGINSPVSLKYPLYKAAGGAPSYVDYKTASGAASVRTACPLVFENVSKVYIYGPIKINENTDYYQATEYVLTQDTTFALGDRYDPS